MRYRVIQTITMMVALAVLSNSCVLAAPSSPVTAVELSSSTTAVERLSSPAANSKVTGDDFHDTLARDTWAHLSSDWATDNHLPWSWRSATLDGGYYANPTEIGLYALSWIGAYEMRRPWSPSWPQVEAEVAAVLNQLRAWQAGSQTYQPHGPNAYDNSAFYQWYWINWNPPVVGADGATSTNHVVPSVDNAWLAACLITIREYGEANDHLALAQKADAILKDMDFAIWYHADTHRFTWGARENPQGGAVADMYSNENRIINFIARALGHLSAEEFRASLAALTQDPDVYDDITVAKVAWDGSLFTYLAPALFVREVETSYGTNTILPAIRAQIAYAHAQGYPVWGFSDCFDIGASGYVQQGAPPVASPAPPETRPGLVTPHASALALITPLASEAIANLQTISNTFPLAYDSPYGFRDSVMVKPGDPQYGMPSARFSALAQAWLFLALVNARTDFVWSYFYRDSGVNRAHVEMYGPWQRFLPMIVKR